MIALCVAAIWKIGSDNARWKLARPTKFVIGPRPFHLKKLKMDGLGHREQDEHRVQGEGGQQEQGDPSPAGPAGRVDSAGDLITDDTNGPACEPARSSAQGQRD